MVANSIHNAVFSYSRAPALSLSPYDVLLIKSESHETRENILGKRIDVNPWDIHDVVKQSSQRVHGLGANDWRGCGHEKNDVREDAIAADRVLQMRPQVQKEVS